LDDTCLGSINILRSVAPSEAVIRQVEKKTAEDFIVQDYPRRHVAIWHLLEVELASVAMNDPLSFRSVTTNKINHPPNILDST
jgi:hypothetical protein